MNGNLHLAAFQSLRGIPTGPPIDNAAFGNAFGLGFSLGALADYPLSETLALQLRLGFSTHGASLKAQEPIRFAYLNPQGSAVTFVDGIFERRLTPNLSTVGIEPLAVFSPFSALPALRLYGGLRVGFAVGKSFEQNETIVDPNDPDAVFNNNSITRNPQSADIPDVSALSLWATVGVGYDVRAGDLVVTPELMLSPSLLNVANNLNPAPGQSASWSYHTVRLGFSFRYAPEIQIKPKEPPEQQTTSATVASNTDTTGTMEKPPESNTPKMQHTPTTYSNSEVNSNSTLSASIAAFSVDENNTESPLVQIKVEQYFAQQMYPLMNFIFYEQGSSDLPEKYRRVSASDTTEYDEQKFYNVNMLKVYYDVLNVIGKRLRKFPKTKITLTGCNNNVGTEVGNIPLSFRRALEVKKYWMDTWGIDSSRIAVRARNLPEKPTTSRDSLGVEENRRVEYTSDSWDIMKPVLVNDTIGIPTTPLIRFKMNTKADNAVAKSKISVRQGDKILKEFNIPGKPDSVLDWSPVIDWETATDQSAVPRTEEPLKFSFEVFDARGEKVAPTGSIPVEQITVEKKREAGTKDMEVAIYRLILFDFNSPQVGPVNATICKQFIMPRLKPGAKVHVTGFTDKLGNPDVNMRLSGARAKSVSDFLKWPEATYKGVGGTRPIYPNDTPEGRIYSRSVEVRLEIPSNAQ